MLKFLPILNKQFFKVLFYCFLIVTLQVSIVNELSANVNLIFCSILVFASLLSFQENLLASSFFTIFSAMLFYDNSIYWFYLIISFVAYRLNPEQIADKFLICLLYAIFFTPVFEIFNPLNMSYLDKLIQSTLVNTLTVIPLFFIVRLFFLTGYNALYAQSRKNS